MVCDQAIDSIPSGFVQLQNVHPATNGKKCMVQGIHVINEVSNTINLTQYLAGAAKASD